MTTPDDQLSNEVPNKHDHDTHDDLIEEAAARFAELFLQQYLYNKQRKKKGSL